MLVMDEICLTIDNCILFCVNEKNNIYFNLIYEDSLYTSTDSQEVVNKY